MNTEERKTSSRPTCKNCLYYHCDATHYCSKETVLLIFPFLQTNITSQLTGSGSEAKH